MSDPLFVVADGARNKSSIFFNFPCHSPKMKMHLQNTRPTTMKNSSFQDAGSSTTGSREDQEHVPFFFIITPSRIRSRCRGVGGQRETSSIFDVGERFSKWGSQSSHCFCPCFVEAGSNFGIALPAGVEPSLETLLFFGNYRQLFNNAKQRQSSARASKDCSPRFSSGGQNFPHQCLRERDVFGQLRSDHREHPPQDDSVSKGSFRHGHY